MDERAARRPGAKIEKKDVSNEKFWVLIDTICPL